MSLLSEFDVSALGPAALQVESALQRFAVSSAPSIIDHQRRIDVINKIQRAVNDALECQGFVLKVLPFGSFVSGLYRACRYDWLLKLCCPPIPCGPLSPVHAPVPSLSHALSRC